MRIRPSASFPHPVLATSTGDYGDRTFQLTLSVAEDPAKERIVLNGAMTLDDPTTIDLLQSGQAVAGLMVNCQDTYLDRFFQSSLGNQELDLSGGQVRGTVLVRGVVLAATDRVALGSTSINPEFLQESKLVGCGAVIAQSEELRFEAGLEKLAPLESIFKLDAHEDVPLGTFRLDLEDEAIVILVPPTLHGFLSLVREQPLRDVLLSALYMPVVMSVLDSMRSEDAYGDKRWHSVITARCSAEGINLKSADLAEAAQLLLGAPLNSLQSVIERVST